MNVQSTHVLKGHTQFGFTTNERNLKLKPKLWSDRGVSYSKDKHTNELSLG